MVKNLNQQNLRGFTLLELVVVLAGLSILSSLAIPNIAKIFDFNNIDEAKALLNTAAADCLQKERLESNIDRGNIDSNILSSNRLKSIGYKIDPEANKCSYLKITPINSKDKFRFERQGWTCEQFSEYALLQSVPHSLSENSLVNS